MRGVNASSGLSPPREQCHVSVACAEQATNAMVGSAMKASLLSLCLSLLCSGLVPSFSHARQIAPRVKPKNKACAKVYTRCAMACNRGSMVYQRQCLQLSDMRQQRSCQRQAQQSEDRCVRSCYRRHCGKLKHHTKTHQEHSMSPRRRPRPRTSAALPPATKPFPHQPAPSAH